MDNSSESGKTLLNVWLSAESLKQTEELRYSSQDFLRGTKRYTRLMRE